MNNILLEWDCLEEMKKIKDKSIDMILCDLPYWITCQTWDSIIPLDLLWIQYERIIKDNWAIVLTSTQPFTTKLISSNYKLFKYSWVWEKTRPSNFANSKIKPMSKHEDICIFSKWKTANGSKNNMLYNPQWLVEVNRLSSRQSSSRFWWIQWKRKCHKDEFIQQYTNYPNTILKFSNPNNWRLHPTQKPVELFEYLIKTYTNEWWTVLDNCAGSGTTWIACKNTNRNYILIENYPEYINIIKQRLWMN